jgi:sporulation-control protein spo0M
MSHALIRQALESTLSAWADAQSPAIPVSWQNVPFTPPTGRYLQAFVLPARTVSETLDGTHRRYTGLFQVSIVMPIDVGPGDAEAIVASLDALYPLSTPITVGALRVYMTEPMSPAPALQRADRYVIPVTGAYRCDTV